MPEELFRVLLPDGTYTKPYPKRQILEAFIANKISKRATVYVGGNELNITVFLTESSVPFCDKKAKGLFQKPRNQF